MTAAPSPVARCSHEYQWTGTGRHRHSSGRNPTYRCEREEGHDGPHAMARQPTPELAPVLVAELPLPRNTPRPLSEKTKARVEEMRSRFGAETIRVPLPANEAKALVELSRAKGALTSKLATHFFRRWLEGN